MSASTATASESHFSKRSSDRRDENENENENDKEKEDDDTILQLNSTFEPPLVDCHAHLLDKKLDEIGGLDQVLRRAYDAGVHCIIGVTESASEFLPMIELAKKYNSLELHRPIVAVCLGLHPVHISTQLSSSSSSSSSSSLSSSSSSCDLNLSSSLSLLESLLSSCVTCPYIVGVGEIGLDFSPWIVKSERDREFQITAFKKQLEIAAKYNLPVNIHSRNAGHHAIHHLQEFFTTNYDDDGADSQMNVNVNVRGAMLHAFDGAAKHVRNSLNSIQRQNSKCKSNGFLCYSIPPSCVRDTHTTALISSLPSTNILLESDAPALSYVKGGINEPRNVRVSLFHLSQHFVPKSSAQSIASACFENSLKLYPKLLPLLSKRLKQAM